MRHSLQCSCGDRRVFTTNTNGQTLETCNGCGYADFLRPRSVAPTEQPRNPKRSPYYVERFGGKTKKRKEPRAVDPVRFRCGHDRSTANTYQHPRGWGECRQCCIERACAAKVRRRLARAS